MHGRVKTEATTTDLTLVQLVTVLTESVLLPTKSSPAISLVTYWIGAVIRDSGTVMQPASW